MQLQAQEHAVLIRLKKGPLTQREATDELGITRLAARVNTLRAKGFNIATEARKVPTRYGRPTRIAVYHLQGVG